MADYISREAAINEYCRNCYLYDVCDEGIQNQCPDINGMIEIPAADVVEVVRCKDCKHFVPNSKIDLLCSGFCKKANWSKSWNDFCSDGERRMDNA